MDITMVVAIVNIPFDWTHVKLVIASVFPVGKTVVEVDELKLLPRMVSQ